MANSIEGDSGDNLLLGRQDEVNFIFGRKGNDRIFGGELFDILRGEQGDDTLHGLGGGDQIFTGSGSDTVIAGSGDDYIRPGNGPDAIDGGRGQDLVDYSKAGGSGVLVDLQLGIGRGSVAEGDSFRSVEDVRGTSGNDRLIGNGWSNELMGGSGADVISGGPGPDFLDGGSGSDMVTYATSRAAVEVDLRSGEGWGGDAHGDLLRGFEMLVGSAFDDILRGDEDGNRIFGQKGSDRIFGRGGADRIEGENGSDRLHGGTGDDNVSGGSGADRLFGDRGADILRGDGGADRFIYRSVADSIAASAGRDTIVDFNHQQRDKIVLSRLDADPTADGDQAFTFISESPFGGSNGELRFSQISAGVRVAADLDGDRAVDFALVLEDVIELTESDFVL